MTTALPPACAFDDLADGISITSAAGQIVLLNNTLCTMLGISRDLFLGAPLAALWQDCGWDVGQLEVLLTDAPVVLSLPDPRQNDRAFEVRASCLPGEGMGLHVLRWRYDLPVTDAALLAEYTDQAAFSCDADGTLLYLNPACERFTGFTTASAIGQHYADVFQFDQKRMLEESLRRAVGNNVVKHGDVRLRLRDMVYFVQVTVKAAPALSGVEIFLVYLDDASYLRKLEQAQKRAIKALERKEHRYRSLVENAAEVTLVQVDDYIMYASNAALKFFGIDNKDAIIGENILNFIHAGDLEVATDLLFAVRPLDEVRELVEMRFIQPNGDGDSKIVYAEVNFVPVTYQSRRATQIVLRDITARKQAEHNVHRLSRQYALILESVGEGIYGLDRQGVVQFVNPAAEKMLGYTAGELLGTNMHSVIHHTAADGTPIFSSECPIHRAMVTNKVLQSESEIFWRKDGTSFEVRVMSTPIVENGRPQGIVVSFQDITARKEAERGVQESEALFRTLSESALTGVFMMLDDQFYYVNPVFSEIFGYTQAEMIGGMGFLELVMPEHEAEMRANLARWRADEIEAMYYSFKGRRKDGTVIECELLLRLVRYKRRTTIIGTLSDISHRKWMQRHMLQVERLAAMGRMAAALAHEINNPLQAIASSLELVLDFPLPDDEKTDYLQAIRREIERLMETANQVLDFARPPNFKLVDLDLAETIRYSLALSGKHLQHKGIAVVLNLPETLPLIKASHNHLAQVFVNLVVNAVEAMPDGGSIIIEAVERSDRVEVTFGDTGPGIDEADLPHIFEPFYTTKNTGTGLGLAVSFNIIKAHHGTIKAENAETGGAVFHIMFPKPV